VGSGGEGKRMIDERYKDKEGIEKIYGYKWAMKEGD